MDYKRLSKTISYALRHHPEKFGLSLDEEGWTDVTTLINSINKQFKNEKMNLEHIKYIIENSDKKRYELKEDKIRAYYGHSTKEKLQLQESKPPKTLFHGTPKIFLDSILRKGLLSKNRQYVHLSVDLQTAVKVGKRRDNYPEILVIDAERAWKDGIKFYHGNEDIWLSDNIPAEYIELLRAKRG